MKLVSKKGRELFKFNVKKENTVFHVVKEDEKEIDFKLDFISKNSFLLKKDGETKDLNYIVKGNIVTIYELGKEYKFEFLDERTVRRLASTGGLNAGGPVVIDSPMPGKIIKVNYKKGDTIKEGDTVLIMEAMKMENEMKAPYDGVITEIFVSESQTIEGGIKLFSLE